MEHREEKKKEPRYGKKKREVVKRKTKIYVERKCTV
jgi:hypothetical protein